MNVSLRVFIFLYLMIFYLYVNIESIYNTNTNKSSPKYIRTICYLMIIFIQAITNDSIIINNNIKDGKIIIVLILRIYNL